MFLLASSAQSSASNPIIDWHHPSGKLRINTEANDHFKTCIRSGYILSDSVFSPRGGEAKSYEMCNVHLLCSMMFQLGRFDR